MNDDLLSRFDRKLRRLIAKDDIGLDIDSFFNSNLNSDDEFSSVYEDWKLETNYSSWTELYEELKGYAPEVIFEEYGDNSACRQVY